MAESDNTSKQQITLGDQPTADDALGFTPYVIAIAEFLTSEQTKPPLTLSIEGEWGSGKSSFMQQLEKQIKEKSKELKDKEIIELWKKLNPASYELRDSYLLEHLQLNGWRGFVEKLKFLKKISFDVPAVDFEQQFKFIKPILFCDLADLCKYLKFILKLYQPTQTIWFNAWRHDKAESLWAAFALSFLEGISENHDWRDIIANSFSYIYLLCSRLDWRNNFWGIVQKLATSAFVLGAAVTIPYLYFFSGGKARIEAFSGNITCQLEEKDQCQDQPRLNILLFLMGGSGSFSATFLLLGKFRELIGDSKLDLTEYLESPDYDSQIAFIEKFHGDFSKIVNAYAGKDEKVYVFIDDLDRCELGKSADLLQALNMMISNDPNLIFILGMDREKVAAAITYKQKDLLPFLNSISGNGENHEQSANNQLMKKLDYGFSFMEKFVQFTFSVPKPSEKILTNFLATISQEKDFQETSKQFFGLSSKRISSFKIFFSQKIQKLIPKKWRLGESGAGDNPEQNDQSPQNIEKISRELAIFPIIDREISPEDLQKIIEMVAPFFDFNTRRLKQYINALRLKIYILYYSVGVTWEESQNPLMLEQVGKFTAIILQYPRLLLCIEDDYSLLEKIENTARLPDFNDQKIFSKQFDISYWMNESRLKTLISYECSQEKFTLKNKETIKQLLQVSSRLELDPKYFKLRSFLANKKFKEADAETDRVMLQVVGKDQYLDENDINNFPCEDLKIIDNLWKKYSNSKFGFSVQKQIWLDCGNVPEIYDHEKYIKFARRAGWIMNDKWLTLSGVDFTMQGVQGHLPLIQYEISYSYVKGIKEREKLLQLLFSRGDV